MSQDSKKLELSRGQKWIVGLTFVGTLVLSILGKPTIAFALVGLGTLLLLLFGSEIGSVTIRLLGGEAVIERAERAEQGALKAAQEANEAVKAVEKTLETVKQFSLDLTSTLLPLTFPSDTIQLRFTTEVSVSNRRSIQEKLEAMGCKPEEISRAFRQFDIITTLQYIDEAAASLNIGYVASELYATLFPGETPNVLHLAKPFSYNVDDLKRFFGERTTMTPELEAWLEEIGRFQVRGTIDFDRKREFEASIKTS